MYVNVLFTRVSDAVEVHGAGELTLTTDMNSCSGCNRLSKQINCGSSSYILLNTAPGAVWTQLTTQSVSSSCAGLCFTQLTRDGGKTKLTMRKSVAIELLLYTSHWCSSWVGGRVRVCLGGTQLSQI